MLKNTEARKSFKLSYHYYESYQGEGQKSGAYIFRAASSQSKPYALTKEVKTTVFRGKFTTLVVLEDDQVQSQMKFFNTAALQDIPEIETLVKGIDVSDGQGKEVVLRIANDIDNKQEFYTDSNGLDLLYRKIDWHPTYQYKEKNDVAANYYPINAMIGLEGKAKDFLSG